MGDQMVQTGMRPDYGNWVPKSMVTGLLAGTLVLGAANVAVWSKALSLGNVARYALRGGLGLALAGCAGFTGWCVYARGQFSHEGTRRLSAAIVETCASYVEVPDGGTCLDVGCGSGALTIAVAKANPTSRVVGVDVWDGPYTSFSRELCERNAVAEGVANVTFTPGDARRLPFADESFDAVTSNYVYHNITGMNRQALLRETLRTLRKGGTFAIHDLMGQGRYGDMDAFVRELLDAGYERVELIPTDDGLIMDRAEATRMMLRGSTLLVGVK